jgi:glycosyltransferase involved in cell wall biosynthesis
MVSIIIPSYNYGFVIEETLKNLQSQSYTDWEAIIVDDGSTDNTGDVVKNVALRDERIRYYAKPNQGVSKARNFGFQQSKGQYIQYLDADDLLSEHKLTRQVAFMEANKEVDISYTDHLYFETDKPEIFYPDYEMNHNNWLPKICASGSKVIETLLGSNIAVVSSPLLRREVVQKVDGFPEYTKHTEDWEFWFLCAVSNARFCFFDDQEAITIIRIHERNTSRNILTMQGGELEFRKRIIIAIKESPNLTEQEKEYLLAKNQKSATNLYKYMMYHANFGDVMEMSQLYKMVNPKKFFKYYFKALNFKRKALFRTPKTLTRNDQF